MNGLLILVLTVLFFSCIGLFFSRKKIESVDAYIISKNALNSRTLSLTIFATGMGVWILFGPAEALLTAGIFALVCYALSSTLSLWMFAYLGKKIREVNPDGKSLTEFVLVRFGTPLYLLVLAVTAAYMALGVTAALSGIGLASSAVFGLPEWQTILIIGSAALSYTALGGFRVSVETDKIQTYVILPLFALLVGASMAYLGDMQAAIELAKIPEFGQSGIEYGIALLIGVLSAEAFNQVWWQRVYSGKDQHAMRTGFFLAGVAVFPVVLLAGLVGVYSGLAPAGGSASTAIFNFLPILPDWLSVSAMILAITLTLSTLDSFLNSIAGLFLIDIKRIVPKIDDGTLINIARALTVVFAGVTMLLSIQGFSVLYLFLVADLICAGAVFAVFYGMFFKAADARVALVAALVGIVCGALLFPDPEFSRGTLAGSFAVALIVPAVIVLTFGRGKNHPKET